MSLTIKVTKTDKTKRMMKKNTAPISWMTGYPSSSIVPIAAKNPRVDI